MLAHARRPIKDKAQDYIKEMMVKIQMKASQQVMDEADKEYKKIYGQITESQDAMKVSYAEFMAEAQASASRVCKVSLSELSRSFEKEIDGLRNRFGNSSS